MVPLNFTKQGRFGNSLPFDGLVGICHPKVRSTPETVIGKPQTDPSTLNSNIEAGASTNAV